MTRALRLLQSLAFLPLILISNRAAAPILAIAVAAAAPRSCSGSAHRARYDRSTPAAP